jgi:hypothetical protein
MSHRLLKTARKQAATTCQLPAKGEKAQREPAALSPYVLGLSRPWEVDYSDGAVTPSGARKASIPPDSP